MIQRPSGTAINLDSGTTNADLTIDGLVIDSAAKSIVNIGLTNGNFSNIVGLNVTEPYMEEENSSNLHFNNIQGIDVELIGGGSGYGFNGFYEGVLHGYYSFGVQGGPIGTIDLKDRLPKHAVVTHFSYKVRSAPTSAQGKATIAIGLIGATTAFKAATIVTDSSWSTSGFFNGIPTGAAANYYWNNSGDADVALTIGAERLTAGFIEWEISYYLAP
jgi:hypothetical protein